MSEQRESCPGCAALRASPSRYPRAVCRTCVSRALSADGRPVRFINAKGGDRVEGRYFDTGDLYESRECFVDGVKCHVEEAHFGGVVMQVAD
jgi:hypothetical protein